MTPRTRAEWSDMLSAWIGKRSLRHIAGRYCFGRRALECWLQRGMLPRGADARQRILDVTGIDVEPLYRMEENARQEMARNHREIGSLTGSEREIRRAEKALRDSGGYRDDPRAVKANLGGWMPTRAPTWLPAGATAGSRAQPRRVMHQAGVGDR